MKEERFVINGKYIAIVQTPKDLDYYPMIRINVGGRDKQCVNVCVYTGSKVAYLAGVGYDGGCILDGLLERGEGTRDLLRCALMFVFQRYPKLDGINFKDASKIRCKNKAQISLAYLGLATRGRTWYENHFGAKLEDKSQRSLHKQLRRYLESEPMMDLGVFKQRYNIDDERIDEVYVSCKTYGGFLKELQRRYLDCSIFVPWLARFFDSCPHCDWLDALWLVKRKKVESWGSVDYKKDRTRLVKVGGGKALGRLSLTQEDV